MLIVKEATNDFNKEKCLGEGAFGVVYSGYIQHSDVAVKILKPVKQTC